MADKDSELGMRGLLGRPPALGIRPITYDIYVHPQRDPGCARRAEEFLRPFARRYRHALVVFDREGCGRDPTPLPTLAEELRGRLAASGWGDRAEVIVLDPELEVWVCAQSPHVERCLGWEQRTPLRDWLRRQGLWPNGKEKPDRPKEALERALRAAGRPRSAAIYQCLGRRVSLRRCADPAFARLRQALHRWFPADDGRLVRDVLTRPFDVRAGDP